MRLLVTFVLVAGLVAAETQNAPAPSRSAPERPVTVRDLPRNKGGKYKVPKPHTAKRAKNANKRVRGSAKMHPVWGRVKSTH